MSKTATRRRLSMREFIRRNRDAITEAIRQQVPNSTLNDDDRRKWVLLDESWYDRARREGVRV